jgi:hypothetical protein
MVNELMPCSRTRCARSRLAKGQWRRNTHDPTSEDRNSRCAVFVVGLNASESSIEQTRYLQAHALLHQEMDEVW